MLKFNPLLFSIWIGAIIFLFIALFGRFVVAALKRDKLSQTEREYGPKSHLKKSGTPTFGGLIFMPPMILIVSVGLILLKRYDLLPTMGLILGMGIIGWIDDYVKVKVNKEGISPKAKSIPMMALILIYIISQLYLMGQPVIIALPFTSKVWLVAGTWKIIYAIFLLIYFYAVINAVNLTDGVDGLLSSVTIPICLLFAVLAMCNHLALPLTRTPHIAVGLVGALAGFLLYNHHKAQVFMGDTGSLSIGAAVGALAFLLGVPWVMLIAGFVYVAEAGSVVIQVVYFKKTGGKRIFRMSPIHHHFELGGWSEHQIVIRFTIFTILMCLITLVTLLPYVNLV